uniref:Uncharacterized protein n=1 Tax=Timema poppense TaxID=170557 RepID=A0A7R9CPV5_TIMPO|nr:unnamed protein product [Timema poppensis]
MKTNKREHNGFYNEKNTVHTLHCCYWIIWLIIATSLRKSIVTAQFL